LTKHPTSTLYDAAMSINRTSFIPEEHSPVDKNGVQQLLPDIPLRVFATTNPYGVGHCVPYGEVLTNNGWVDIKKITTDHKALTMNKQGEAFYSEISATITEEYDGVMIKRKGRGLNLEFTENHRLPKKTSNGFEVMPFTELNGDPKIVRSCSSWKGISPDVFTLTQSPSRKLKLSQPFTIAWSDYCEFMGWFISEGYTVDRDKAFGISQSKPHHRATITALLERCGFKYQKSKTAFTVHSVTWWKYLKQFGKSRDKFIPQQLLNSETSDLKILLNALLDGDGCRPAKHSVGAYYTTSKRLRDDVCELGVKLGLNVYTSKRVRRTDDDILGTTKKKERPTGSPDWSYYVGLSVGRPISLNTGNHTYNVKTKNNNVNVTRSNFKGLVYCITVPETEVFFIRQKGTVWLSGNSWIKHRFIDPAPAGVPVATTAEVFNPRTQQEVEITKYQVQIFSSYKENRYLSPEYVLDPNTMSLATFVFRWAGLSTVHLIGVLLPRSVWGGGLNQTVTI